MDSYKQTFYSVLQSGDGCGTISSNKGWLICPACERWKILRLLPSTEARDLVVYCKLCHQESIVNISPESQRL